MSTPFPSTETPDKNGANATPDPLPIPSPEDDFGDEELAPRQPGTCSLEDDCLACQ